MHEDQNQSWAKRYNNDSRRGRSNVERKFILTSPRRNRPMLFGHNTNVSVGESVFHVQTEDRGEEQALIDTTVYFLGRVLPRRTNNYQDLLPLDSQKEVVLKQRVDDQHRNVEDDIRSGVLALPAEVRSAAQQMPELRVELLNAKNWLNGKRASLHVIVQD